MKKNENKKNELEEVTTADTNATETTASTTEDTEAKEIVSNETLAKPEEKAKKEKKEKQPKKKDPATMTEQEKKELEVANIEKAAKKAIMRRKMKYGAVAMAITIITVILVILVNVILYFVGKKVDLSIDLTENSIFEISQESIDYLATIDEEVSIVCMSDELTFQTTSYIYLKQAYEVLKKYEIYSDNITVKYVDIVEDPTYVNRYSSTYNGDISQYDIVIESSKRIKVISIEDLYNIETSYYGYGEVTSSKAEQTLTSAIMYVTDPSPTKVVMFTSDSSNSYSYSNIYDLLESNSYEITEIDPLTEEIPEDTELVIINAPLNDYDDNVINKIYSFLDNNGNLGKNLIYIADYSQNDTSNIDAFLAEWGLKVENGVVAESDGTVVYDNYGFMSAAYIEENDYTENVSSLSLPYIVYYSRSITRLFDSSDNRATTSLLATADTAYLLTDEIAEAGDISLVEYGSRDLIALSSKYVFDSDNNMVYSNVLVFGSAYSLASSFTETTYYNNGEYFMSIVNTLTGKTTGISIVAKDLTAATFDVTQDIYNNCTTIFMWVIPGLVVVIGIVVFFTRRSK